ncbi:sugar O-acetyltransferase [Halomarina oriensis]|uniref:Acetyltransferase n=1 Tax=Halomarina oriensis TaxID=671145 RepID=A0A6B0GM83_9EURY|nr:sugar O-acetyltransferase [Halomarina oriensis]MWG36006.1 acetyltransferase [Halomarina oriensis]
MDSEREKMLAGEPYDPSDAELVADRRRAESTAAEYNRTDPDESDERQRLLDGLFGSVGEHVSVEPPVRCDYGSNVHVGDRFFANVDCVFLDVCRIEFGDDCMLGPGVHVYTATHPLNPEERAAGLEYGKPVTVGDDVWVGGRAVLNPGVTVGDGAMVASGAVVTEDVPPRVVVQGNPADVVREIE